MKYRTFLITALLRLHYPGKIQKRHAALFSRHTTPWSRFLRSATFPYLNDRETSLFNASITKLGHFAIFDSLVNLLKVGHVTPSHKEPFYLEYSKHPRLRTHSFQGQPE